MEGTIELIAQITTLVFLFGLGITLVVNMRKDGILTADEVAKVVIMGLLIYLTVVDAGRDPGTPRLFDNSTYLILVSSVLILAGISNNTINNLMNGNKRKDSKDSQ